MEFLKWTDKAINTVMFLIGVMLLTFSVIVMGALAAEWLLHHAITFIGHG